MDRVCNASVRCVCREKVFFTEVKRRIVCIALQVAPLLLVACPQRQVRWPFAFSNAFQLLASCDDWLPSTSQAKLLRSSTYSEATIRVGRVLGEI